MRYASVIHHIAQDDTPLVGHVVVLFRSPDVARLGSLLAVAAAAVVVAAVAVIVVGGVCRVCGAAGASPALLRVGVLVLMQLRLFEMVASLVEQPRDLCDTMLDQRRLLCHPSTLARPRGAQQVVEERAGASDLAPEVDDLRLRRDVICRGLGLLSSSWWVGVQDPVMVVVMMMRRVVMVVMMMMSTLCRYGRWMRPSRSAAWPCLANSSTRTRTSTSTALLSHRAARWTPPLRPKMTLHPIIKLHLILPPSFVGISMMRGRGGAKLVPMATLWTVFLQGHGSLSLFGPKMLVEYVLYGIVSGNAEG